MPRGFLCLVAKREACNPKSPKIPDKILGKHGGINVRLSGDRKEAQNPIKTEFRGNWTYQERLCGVAECLQAHTFLIQVAIDLFSAR